MQIHRVRTRHGLYLQLLRIGSGRATSWGSPSTTSTKGTRPTSGSRPGPTRYGAASPDRDALSGRRSFSHFPAARERHDPQPIQEGGIDTRYGRLHVSQAHHIIAAAGQIHSAVFLLSCHPQQHTYLCTARYAVPSPRLPGSHLRPAAEKPRTQAQPAFPQQADTPAYLPF